MNWVKNLNNNTRKLRDYLPPFSWIKGAENMNKLIQELRKQNIVNISNVTNQTTWNQEFIKNTVEDNRTYVTNIYNEATNPNQDNDRPYLPSKEYLNPIGSDTNTTYQTPVGNPILLSDQLAEDKQNYGKLTYNPLAFASKLKIRKAPDNSEFSSKIKTAHKKNIVRILAQKYYHVHSDEESPEFISEIQSQGFLLCPSNLASNSGKGELIAGIETISYIAQQYKANNSLAGLPPTNLIPSEIEEIEVKDVLEKFDFNSLKLGIDIRDPQTLLGYNVFQEDWDNRVLEEVLEELGLVQYKVKNQPTNPKTADEIIKGNKITKFSSLAEYITHLIATIFFRSGFHRLPATFPEKLTVPEEDTKNNLIFLEDNLEIQEYLIRNLDSILGQFPLKFRYIPEIGEEQIIKVPNIAEALTELLGINQNTNHDTDALIAMGTKLLIESTWNKQVTNTIHDFVEAIADYLGFNYKTKKEDITIPINPEAKKLSELLKEQKYETLTIENVDKNTIAEQLKLIVLASQIIKSSQGFNKSIIPSDAISEQKEKDTERYNKSWEELLENIKKRYPTMKIKEKNS